MMLIKQYLFLFLNNRFLMKPAFILLFILLVCFGCGKRQLPLPPVERIPQRVEITGFQRGNTVNLSWQIPARNVSDKSVVNIDRVEIYRLAQPFSAPPFLNEEEFASRSTLISSLPITESDWKRKTLNFTDNLEFAGQRARLIYSIRFVNSAGQRAAFSNFLLIEPESRVAASPRGLVVNVSEEVIRLEWKEPDSNIDGSKPANVLGYNVYRKAAEEVGFKILNKTPVTKTDFSDISFKFGGKYGYFVRSVSLGSNGEPVESGESTAIEVLPRDTFAPTAPTAITIAAAPNNLSIFFAINPEPDIVGYRIYRAMNPDLPKSQWQLLTPKILTTNTFQDTQVTAGVTYYYYLTAVDKAGNISQPSEVISEIVP